MEVVPLASVDEVAVLAADTIEALVRARPACVLGLATGSSPVPALTVSNVASTTADSGNRRMATVAAPSPTATAGVSEKPGRWEAMMPPAAPRNTAGNVGPPRYPASEMLHAALLSTMTRASAPSDHPPASATSPGSWS